jgi:glutathione S-transferase
MPFGQVPVLEVDGHFLAESYAILRYAGGLAGLVPSEPLAAAKVDEVRLHAFLNVIAF